MQLNKQISTKDINAQFLQGYKMPATTINFMLDEIIMLKYAEGQTDEEKNEDVTMFLEDARQYELQFVHSLVLHALEVARGAQKRGILDDLTVDEYCNYVFTDVGFIK